MARTMKIATIATTNLLHAPSSLDPLPLNIRNGMFTASITGFLSLVSTLTVITFITYRAIFWRAYYTRSIARNQVLVLIYNLLVADLHQALAFLLSFYWITKNKMVGPSAACTAQGWLVQFGDVSSGLWVLSIAVQTFVTVVLMKKIGIEVFITWVVVVWLFSFGVSIAGPMMHKDIFVPTAAWCWIDAQYKWERLYLHYIYIFIAQLGCITLYLITFIHLFVRIRRHPTWDQNHPYKTTNIGSTHSLHPLTATHTQNLPTLTGYQNESSYSVTISSIPYPVTTSKPSTPDLKSNTKINPNINSKSKIPHKPTTTKKSSLLPNTVTEATRTHGFASTRHLLIRTTRYMVLYPLVYVATTLPLAAARTATMAGHSPSVDWYMVAGTLITCCGWVDALLYLVTRRAILGGMVRRDRVDRDGRGEEGGRECGRGMGVR